MKPDTFGELVLTNGRDPFTGEWFKGQRMYPFFGCGHCSRPVAMNPGRERPRRRCLSCSRLICDNELCSPERAGCTPIYALADDHFEAPAKWTNHLGAILKGATTLEEAAQLPPSE